ncbi:flavin reductase family protein [Cryptosporangium minutisporangium]|uniref:Flavin reductase family protein n=1 Tax=Cryptosporangium minutisporangium TaxID=113569 RepID=A0ABP6T8Z5_9ACTN
MNRHTYRQVLGHFATGVVIVTAATVPGPVGLSINSFTAVSLEPPLVGFFPAVTSRSWPAIEQVGAFCVNMLGVDQEPLAHRFAGAVADRFAGVGWRPAPMSTAPVLDGVIAWIDCALESVSPAGDHLFVTGRVTAAGLRAENDPLVFAHGRYRRLAPDGWGGPDGSGFADG